MSYTISFKNLPFSPNRCQIIYVENAYDEEMNAFLLANYENICKSFREIDFDFRYLPKEAELLASPDFQSYLWPTQEISYNTEDARRLSERLLDFMTTPQNKSHIKPGVMLFRFSEREDRRWTERIFSYVPTTPDDFTDITKLAYTLNISTGEIRYHCAPNRYAQNEKADAEFEHDTAILNLKQEIREKVEQLRVYGVDEWVIEELFHPKQQLSRLIIAKDNTLVLPDYNQTITLSPFQKAIYLLFLRHEEGILFKALPDYESELLSLYLALRPSASKEEAQKRVQHVLNPCANDINSYCAHIKGAFLNAFNDHIARNYYIDGKRGEPKKILLPRNLVEGLTV